MQRTHSNTLPGSTPRSQTPPSPFGPMRKRQQPKPGIPPQRTEPDPLPKRRPPAGVTPLTIAGRPPKPNALSDQAKAEIDAWYATHTPAPAPETPAPDATVTRLHQLATQAHTAPDLADYRSAA